LLRHPLARRLTRVLGWLILSVILLLAALASVVQFWLLPRLPQFKPELAARLSHSIGQTVSIGELGGGWRHGQLVLFMRQVAVTQPGTGATQQFDRLELAPSLSSLWHLEPRFDRIALTGPVIHIRRDTHH